MINRIIMDLLLLIAVSSAGAACAGTLPNGEYNMPVQLKESEVSWTLDENKGLAFILPYTSAGNLHTSWSEASRLCKGTHDGFSDWLLPEPSQLNELTGYPGPYWSRQIDTGVHGNGKIASVDVVKIMNHGKLAPICVRARYDRKGAK